MKKHHGLFYCLLIGSCFLACDQDRDKQKAVDMITTRTMGLAYLEEDKFQEAESSFRQLISIAPNEALGYANLGLVYIRKGEYDKAEIQLKKALKIEPYDPEIQLNLADILFLTNRQEEAIYLLDETLRYHQDHIRTLYKLGQTFSKSDKPERLERGEKLLIQVVGFLPANIAARLELVDLLLRVKNVTLAKEYLTKLKSLMPEFPKQSDEFYRRCLQLLSQSKPEKALRDFNIFRNILKPTPFYRVGIDELKGIGGPLIGTPVISFRRSISSPDQTQQLIVDAIQFTDVSEAAGLNLMPQLQEDSSDPDNSPYILTLADFDGNGTQDLYVSGFSSLDKENYRFLLENRFGRFFDITKVAGINHRGIDKNALFTDYDNDGYLDLFIVNDTSNLLYYHFKPKKFRNTAVSAGISGTGFGNFARFADFDHDGDLDLYVSNKKHNLFFRNNLDGTFSEQAIKMGISGNETASDKTVIGDFDDDGDLDFFIINPETGHILYSNLRQGEFVDVTTERGLKSAEFSVAVASGDYNNDGLLDLFLGFKDGGYRLYANIDGTHFEEDTRSVELESVLKGYLCSDVLFFDFDNDGFLDLLVSGEEVTTSSEKSGLHLFHNGGNGIFRHVSKLLPADLPPGYQISTADYNEDGDLDIFFSTKNGKVVLLRNDGGNTNRYLTVQLVGLRTGSGKNNYFGIGAKIEVKAGDLYQSHTVTQPVSHFGLGQRDNADIVRVLWTNGVPQNIFKPGSDQTLLEKQVLKGSCPFLYTWNGGQYEFVTDVLWRSALGMPLGIMAGETAFAFADPSEDYFKIPGDMLKKKNGIYSIQLTCELWETAYFDQVKLYVVDHPDSADIYVDERFTPPPYPLFKIYKAANRRFPNSAIDELGNDILDKIKTKDNVYIADLEMNTYQGIAQPHDIILDLGNFQRRDSVLLYLNGWVFPTDASINQAVSQSTQFETYPPKVQVRDQKGVWRTVIDNISFPMGKNKYVIVDLTDKFLSSEHLVRIRTTMQIYWDYIFFTVGEQEIPVRLKTLFPQKADLHYRGFSAMFRKGGPSGPFWFDYTNVSAEPKWRDLEGYYTRYGDVVELLIEVDSKYVITNAGDEITVEFEALTLPEVEPGWSRDFIIFTGGWLKDGDLNTATGQYVKPLPFRGMSCYPYGTDESYPSTEEYQRFLKEYITRKVSTERFRDLISKK
jgi:tetratricopeptide (TPR) repeat protein